MRSFDVRVTVDAAVPGAVTEEMVETVVAALRGVRAVVLLGAGVTVEELFADETDPATACPPSPLESDGDAAAEWSIDARMAERAAEAEETFRRR